MSTENLIGDYAILKPQHSENLIDTELYELITPKSHGTDYSFNILKILQNGSIKEQSHAEEHSIFILDGKCNILLGEEWVSVKKGNFLHIPANLRHSFRNKEKTPVEILILKK
jgi:quercetin dioxygenase-like cupin family protein